MDRAGDVRDQSHKQFTAYFCQIDLRISSCYFEFRTKIFDATLSAMHMEEEEGEEEGDEEEAITKLIMRKSISLTRMVKSSRGHGSRYPPTQIFNTMKAL
jgi:hypothetical protein